jgi:hypothetical protein
MTGQGWWARRTVPQRILLAVAGGLLALAVIANALGGLVGGDPGGPASSSFSTGSDGLQGWASLLERRGVHVVQRRDAPGEGDLRVGDAVVLADPGPDLDEGLVWRLAAFVRAGGRLVAVGPSGADAAAAIAGAPLDVGGGAGAARAWVPVPETAGVRALAPGAARLDPSGPWVPVAGDDRGRAVVVVASVGAGRVVVLADAALGDNTGLALADDAALALAVVGAPDRVVFLESVHGFGATGLAALPSSWKWAFAGLVAALVLGLWSAAARFGPPEADRRVLRPPRVDHVEAIAADLGRVVRTEAEAVAPLARAVGVDPAQVLTATDAHHLAADAARSQRARRGLPPVATVPSDQPDPGARP